MENYTVVLLDDGTTDTVVSVNGREYRFSDVDRSSPEWFDEIRFQATEGYEQDIADEANQDKIYGGK